MAVTLLTGEIGSHAAGEYLSNTGSPIGITSGAWKTIMTFALPAGDWDVDAQISIAITGPSGNMSFAGGISTVPNGDPGGVQMTVVASAYQKFVVPVKRLNVAATTNIYVNAFVSAAGTLSGTAFLQARRWQ